MIEYTCLIMKEEAVREALHTFLRDNLKDKYFNSLIIDELGLMEGSFRVDMAVIHKDEMHGFEIKSAADNLKRLPAQQENYCKVFDRMTLVCDQKHVAEALEIVPKWWGLICVSEKDDRPYLNEIWPSRTNFEVDPYSMCQLLWREEAFALLRENGMHRGFRKGSRKKMWKALASTLDTSEIRRAIRLKLAARKDWR
ncbi:MAG: sce7726 family protein [Cyanobacteriota/Melainabacteria group bacterium]|nr:sce7726 family protein [Cyanobacteria bacterium HKST-UBA01]MCB9471264.1 sce7726 family protein [Candidatus Obscuribacterales bacterium]